MTREQAIQCLTKIPTDMQGRPYNSQEWLVSSLLSLGVLKVDEPKDTQSQFLDNLFGSGFGPREFSYHALRQELIDAGVKIVRK